MIFLGKQSREGGDGISSLQFYSRLRRRTAAVLETHSHEVRDGDKTDKDGPDADLGTTLKSLCPRPHWQGDHPPPPAVPVTPQERGRQNSHISGRGFRIVRAVVESPGPPQHQPGQPPEWSDHGLPPAEGGWRSSKAGGLWPKTSRSLSKPDGTAPDPNPGPSSISAPKYSDGLFLN